MQIEGLCEAARSCTSQVDRASDCFIYLQAPQSTVSHDCEDVKGKINGHIFQSHNYFTPTFCFYCKKLLKGLIKQARVWHAPLTGRANSARDVS